MGLAVAVVAVANAAAAVVEVVAANAVVVGAAAVAVEYVGCDGCDDGDDVAHYLCVVVLSGLPSCHEPGSSRRCVGSNPSSRKKLSPSIKRRMKIFRGCFTFKADSKQRDVAKNKICAQQFRCVCAFMC